MFATHDGERGILEDISQASHSKPRLFLKIVAKYDSMVTPRFQSTIVLKMRYLHNTN